jgi:hypothetical protein
MRIRITIALLVATLGPVPLEAQQSANFKLSQRVQNHGGTPLAATGGALSSSSFRVKLSSIGEGLSNAVVSSGSFRVDSGHVPSLLPPGEAVGVRFTAPDTLVWNAHLSAGSYNLYRGLHDSLAGLGFGDCEQTQLPSSTATDTDVLSSGDTFFYLVTVANRLGEEGGKGNQSSGAPRQGTACP